MTLEEAGYEVFQTPTSPRREQFKHFPWYLGTISRIDAEIKLLQDGQDEGTFLVRDARPSTVSDPYRLSVLEWRDGQCKIFHCKIQVNLSGEYYIDPMVCFPTVEQLIQYYQETVTSMRTRLTSPYSGSRRKNTSGVEMSRDKLTFIEKISSHREKPAEVWKATLDETGGLVAVKMQKNGGEEGGERIMEQASVLKILKHSNIVRLVGVVTPFPSCVVTEYHQNRDLLGFLLQNDCYETAFSQLLVVAEQLASALDYISSMRFVHRNVRAANLLVDNDLNAKLTGFSYAESLNENGFYFAKSDEQYEKSMYRWMATEGLSFGRFSTASDVWSFAFFLYELFTKGELPFADILLPSILGAVQDGMRPGRQAGLPESIYNLMQKCWRHEPTERPTFKKVITNIRHIRVAHEHCNEPPLGKSVKTTTPQPVDRQVDRIYL